VLLAEDNAINAEIASRILAGARPRGRLPKTGRRRVERFLASAPGTYRAILHGHLQMPLLNGYEATAARSAPGTPRRLKASPSWP
jgi:CheY-like chemotaxis protein